MTIEARLADGRILKFPDGTSQDVIQATVKRTLSESPKQAFADRNIPDPSAQLALRDAGITAAPAPNAASGPGELSIGPFETGVQTPEKVNQFLAGAGSALVNALKGVEQALGLGEIPDAGAELALRRMGLKEDPKTEIAETAKRDRPLLSTGPGLAGNIAGNIAAFAPTAAVPGAGTYKGATALGGAIGALQPVEEGDDRLVNALMGAAGGGVARGVLGAGSRALNPRGSPQVQALMSEGVTPTPGQIAGGAGKRVEEGLTSVPILGDFIKGSQRRALGEFNKAAINKVTSPLGIKIDKTGREGVEEAYEAVSGQYKALLPSLKIAPDKIFPKELDAARKLAADLPEPQLKQFERILKNKVIEKLPKSGTMDGALMKEIDTELGRLSRGYRSSADFDARELGSVLEAVKSSLRDLTARTNPLVAPQIKLIDKAYSGLLRIENAAARTGAREGVFTPSQLKSATRAMDPSMRKRKFAQGKAQFQEFAEAGENVLGSTVPDSGTPFRTTGLLGTGAGLLADPVTTTAVIGGGSALYTTPAQKAIAALLTQRPELARGLGRGLERFNPLAAALGAGSTRSTGRLGYEP